jgi:hypothetical protein
MVDYFTDYLSSGDWPDGTLDPVRWPDVRPSDATPVITAGQLELTVEPGQPGVFAVKSATAYNGPYYGLVAPGDGVTVQVDMSGANVSTRSADLTILFSYVDLSINAVVAPFAQMYISRASTRKLALEYWDGASLDGYLELTYSPVTHAWLRMRLDALGVLVFESSPDGIAWAEMLRGPTFPIAPALVDISVSGDGGTARLSSLQISSTTPSGGNEVGGGGGTAPAAPPKDAYVPIADPADDPPTPASPRTPDKNKLVPAATKTCKSILDLVREFQAATGYAVRITGTSSVELVNPNAPLPSMFRNGHGHEYYSETEEALASSSKVLRLLSGTMDLQASASITADDVGIVTSNWRIPQRLPFPNLPPAPVKRVGYTFSPQGFRAGIEFAYESVPIEVRRVDG